MARPERLVLFAGTATEVGKTWTAAALLRTARDAGLSVAARKPVQSYEATDTMTDADVLAAATGESSSAVCGEHRRYPLAMAPPMAADALGVTCPSVGDLVDELVWPTGCELGVVEAVGGVRSPLASDGDTVDLARVLEPDIVVLIADASLGAINAVRLCVAALEPYRTVVFLNRFAGEEVQRRNREWLTVRDGFTVATSIEELLEQTRLRCKECT